MTTPTATTAAAVAGGRSLIDQLRTAALLYASRGWHVFPLLTGLPRPPREPVRPVRPMVPARSHRLGTARHHL